MKVYVEHCWGGNNKFYFRLTFQHEGRSVREHVGFHDGNWDRATAIEAKDLLERVYKLNRKNIRFVHN